MLLSFQQAAGSAVDAPDGNVGTLRDLVFDRDTWSIRYLVVRVEGWIRRHRVLLATEAVRRADWSGGRLEVFPTREVIKKSPHLDDIPTIPRRQELDLVRHFGWKPYWQTGVVGVPDGPGISSPTVPETLPTEEAAPASLWNVLELIDYAAVAVDQPLGSIGDVLFDDEDWTIRQLAVGVGGWAGGRRIVIPTGQIQMIDWDHREVRLPVAKAAAEQQSLEYAPQPAGQP